MPHWSTQLDRLDLITILNLNDQFSQVSFEMLVVHACQCVDRVLLRSSRAFA